MASRWVSKSGPALVGEEYVHMYRSPNVEPLHPYFMKTLGR